MKVGMFRERILILGRVPQWFRRKLALELPLEELAQPDPEELAARLDDGVKGIVLRGSVVVDEAILRALPRLQFVARTGVGVEGIDLEAASRQGIPVLYTPLAHAQTVAEHSLALLLACAKRLQEWKSLLQEGRWEERDRLRSRELRGARVGIVGMGRIGSRVWRLLRPFGCRFLICDPYVDPRPYQRYGLPFLSLEEVLEESHFVSLHVPLTAETRELIHAGNLARFRSGAVLVNTSRGGVLPPPTVLLEALEEGPLGCLGLDVFRQEPPPLPDPLLQHPRVVATPHVAARTGPAQARILGTLLREIRSVLRGERPRPVNVANAQQLGWSD